MVAVSSLGFSVYEQYTSNNNADGSSSQSGDLQAGLTVGTDDGSKYGSSIILDVKQAAAAKKISDGVSAVNTLTKVANYERTQAPKDAASGRLAQAIQELRALNLVGGGIHSVQQAARIAQDIASALRDLASAEQSTAADGNPADASEGASAGAAAAAASAALSGASDGSTATASPSTASTSTASNDVKSENKSSAGPDAGYSTQVGASLTGLIAGQAGLGTSAAADTKVSSGLAKAIIAQLQATGLPVDGSNLAKSLRDLITNPLQGAKELQESAKQAGLNITVAASVDVKNAPADPRTAAASATPAATAAGEINDPYDELIQDAVAALSVIGKGLKKALPPLLHSSNQKIAREARKAQDQFAQAVSGSVTSVGDYFTAQARIEAEGGTDGTPNLFTRAQIDAADAVINGPDAANHDGGTVKDVTDNPYGTSSFDDTAPPTTEPSSISGATIGIHVSVDIQV